MSPCRPPQGQVGTGRVGTTGGWLGVGPGGQPHCTPSLALISAQCGAHSSRTALGVTRHASGHQTGSSFHLVQLWRGASGLTLPPLGRGPVPAWSEAVARSQTLPPLLPVHRPFHRTSCSRMAGQGGPSPGRQGRAGPLQDGGAGWPLSRTAGHGHSCSRTGPPQAPWPSRHSAVSLTVPCDAHLITVGGGRQHPRTLG